MANDAQPSLNSCYIIDFAGFRNYAIFLFVTQFGLRSIEVAAAGGRP
jgi:hypothetical protein